MQLEVAPFLYLYAKKLKKKKVKNYEKRSCTCALIKSLMVQILPKEENGTVLKEMCESSCQSLVLFPSTELQCSGTSLR